LSAILARFWSSSTAPRRQELLVLKHNHAA
jgi:hypothetical protein